MKIFLDTGNLKEIAALVPLGIIDGVTTNPSLMAKEGGDSRAIIDEHVVVKVPFTRDGVQATKVLASEGKRVNVTLIFSPTQALIAAKVGAAYVSPFIGRLDDIGSNGMALVEACFKHPLTDIGLEKFLKDWEKAQASRA